jgi:acyl carrier protein
MRALRFPLSNNLSLRNFKVFSVRPGRTGRPKGSSIEPQTRTEKFPVTTDTASPYSRAEIVKLVQDRLADILEIEPAKIVEGSSFSEDLDADSLALIELVEALEADLREKAPEFRIDDEDLEDLRTVRDAVDYVHNKLAQG